MKRILLTGGSGLLGQELMILNPNIMAPPHNKLDIADVREFHKLQYYPNFDTIIHCAALLDDKIIKDQPHMAIMTNIVGTANIAMYASIMNIRLVFLSTDYIYKGDRVGGYSETDEIMPFNFYAWTKLGGECAVRGVKNHLIIRTTFGPPKFPYKQAFDDAYRSKDYVDVIAPMVYEAAISDLQGVINIGTERKTIYEYAKQRNTDVQPVNVRDSGFSAPLDTSLNLDKWNNYKNGKTNI